MSMGSLTLVYNYRAVELTKTKTVCAYGDTRIDKSQRVDEADKSERSMGLRYRIRLREGQQD